MRLILAKYVAIAKVLAITTSESFFRGLKGL